MFEKQCRSHFQIDKVKELRVEFAFGSLENWLSLAQNYIYDLAVLIDKEISFEYFESLNFFTAFLEISDHY